jgi:hypothetical protein
MITASVPTNETVENMVCPLKLAADRVPYLELQTCSENCAWRMTVSYAAGDERTACAIAVMALGNIIH